VALVALYLLFRRVELPRTRALPNGPRRGLLAAGAARLGRGRLEFCLVFYAPQLLEVGARLDTGHAAAVLSLFFLDELAGRMAGGGLTRRPARAPALAAVGLALGAADGLTDLGTARTHLLTGIAVIAAPLALGSLADAVGVLRAFAFVPVLIAVALLLLLTRARVPLPLRSSRPGA
jgi:hypothetical protein